MEAFGDILATIVSNSHFWKRPIALEMNTFESYVGPHIFNIADILQSLVLISMWRPLPDVPGSKTDIIALLLLLHQELVLEFNIKFDIKKLVPE